MGGVTVKAAAPPLLEPTPLLVFIHALLPQRPPHGRNRQPPALLSQGGEVQQGPTPGSVPNAAALLPFRHCHPSQRCTRLTTLAEPPLILLPARA